MDASIAFYWVCKGLALLGAVRVGGELVRVLAWFLWYLVMELRDYGDDDD